MGEHTTRAGVTQLVECNLAKVDVAGSNPVSRSKLRAPVAQLDRASGYEPEGRMFESCRAHHITLTLLFKV